MYSLGVKRLVDDAIIPTRGSEDAVGYDLHCSTDFTLDGNVPVCVPTGISIKLPPAVYGRIAPRSGLSVKHGVHIMAGVVDPDYTGEIKVVMCSVSGSRQSFQKGDRIAQLILERCEVPTVVEIDAVNDTSRGSGGFGSTGL